MAGTMTLKLTTMMMLMIRSSDSYYGSLRDFICADETTYLARTEEVGAVPYFTTSSKNPSENTKSLGTSVCLVVL